MKRTPLLALMAFCSPLLAQQPPQGSQPSMSEVFMHQLDADKDGKVSKEEFLKPHEAEFAHIDTNQDGSIDKAEIEAFAAAMRQRMEQLRQQQPTR